MVMVKLFCRYLGASGDGMMDDGSDDGPRNAIPAPDN